MLVLFAARVKLLGLSFSVDAIIIRQVNQNALCFFLTIDHLTSLSLGPDIRLSRVHRVRRTYMFSSAFLDSLIERTNVCF